MSDTALRIADLLVVPDASFPLGPGTPVSVGIKLADDRVWWGDVIPPSGADAETTARAARLARDLITPSLVGQPLETFRVLWTQARHALEVRQSDSDGYEAAAAADRAWQHAFLDAAAAVQGLSVSECIRREYDLAAHEIAAPPSLFLEIGDYAATAERIDRMLALRPTGLGYRLTGGRVAEAIGADAERLQRFVRELGQRAGMLLGDGYRPAIYLGLNGALGRLAGDPIRHIGKVLANVVGLQSAAGERQLIIESPFLIGEAVEQAANLHRLKDFIRRTPTSLRRTYPTLLVADGRALVAADLQLYIDVSAVHAFLLDPITNDLDATLSAIAQIHAAGFGYFLYLPGNATPRWAAKTVAIATAARPLGFVAQLHLDVMSIPTLITRLLAEEDTSLAVS